MKHLYSTYIYFIFLSILLSANISLKKNITSLLNTTDIKYFNDELIVSTEGGVYLYSDEVYTDYTEKLNSYNISSINIDNSNRTWLTSIENGSIHIFDENFNLLDFIDYPAFDRILKIVYSDNYAYALIYNDQEYFIVQYDNDSNSVSYLNIINNFNLSFNDINDIEIYNSMFYIGTDNGLIESDLTINESTLTSSLSWSISYQGMNIKSIKNSYFLNDSNEIYNINSNQLIFVISPLNNEQLLEISEVTNGNIYIQSESSLYLFDIITQQINYIQRPNNILTSFTSFSRNLDYYYFGLENGGILSYSINDGIWDNFIPNTIYQNQFDAINLTTDGKLYGVSNYALDQGHSGGFLCINPLSIGGNSSYYNFYSYDSYKINEYPESKSFYNAKILNYWSGTKSVGSITAVNNNIFFPNSGLYDPTYMPFYNNISSQYNFNLPTNPGLSIGGVIGLNISNITNILIAESWNMAYDFLDGLNGLYDNSPGGSLPYIVINQILNYDDNLYILNPYAERRNQPLVIRQKNTGYLFHVQDNSQAYLPKELAVDVNGNVWICYQYELDISDSFVYSPGGIRMVEVKNISNPNDDRWHNDLIPELDGVNIWSVAVGFNYYNDEVLWILSDLGVQGYIINKTYSQSGNLSIDFQKINNDFYFSNLSFVDGCKIRIDNVGNVWITTKNNGLRIIKNNGEVLSQNSTISFNNDTIGILSNNIYDIVFDNNGNVFVATELGISVLETSFSADVKNKYISVSPNPFQIGVDDRLILSNISKPSIVKIMNLSGKVLNTFNISENDMFIQWDGKDSRGKFLNTDVYLLTTFNERYGSGVVKLAVIK